MIENKKSVLGMVLLSLVLGASLVLTSCQKGTEKSVDPSTLRGGETRPTLSPAYFTGRVAKAYAIAKEIPEVLDSMYCYCECKKNFDHKSLLSCYVDEHARYCDICMDEAFMAYDLHKKGKDIVAIRKAVDNRYSR